MIEYFVYTLPIMFESLPISSSGHEQLLRMFLEKTSTDIPTKLISSDCLDHLLHGPIAIVIALFFFPRWSPIFFHPWRYRWIITKMLLLGLITEIPTLLLYYMWQKNYIFLPLSLAFIISALLIYSLRFCTTYYNLTRWNLVTALWLGTAQGIALIPGISRFGTTLVTGRWLGFSSKKSFELSFLIEFPISVAGFAKGLYCSLNDPFITQLLNLKFYLFMLLAMVGAYSGFFIISSIIQQQKLWLFSIYLFVISIISMIGERWF